MKYGTLYGVGVGPGDPELVTLKAVKILRHVAVVFAASSTQNNYSLAVEIATPHLEPGTPVVHLGFPMTRDKTLLMDAWAENGRKVVGALKDGKDAAFITLGDPLIYSTFGYILETVRKTHPEISIEIIPGVSSFQAGAAAAGRVLVEGEQSLVVITGIEGGKRLKQVFAHADNVVMLKVYRNYREIFDTLDELDLTDRSILVSRCGQEGEEIVRNLKDRDSTPPHYMSHLIIRNKS